MNNKSHANPRAETKSRVWGGPTLDFFAERDSLGPIGLLGRAQFFVW